jgi:hypothetical protein
MYGILRTSTNTGSDAEILIQFVAPLTVISNQPVFASDALSLRRVVSSQSVQRWEIEANLMPSNDSASFLAHSVLKGYSAVFQLRMPQVYRPAALKTPTGGTIQVSGGLAAGATNMNVVGLGGGEVAIGEFFQFTGINKVFLVTDGGTAGVGVGFYPPVPESVSTLTTLIFGDKVTCHVRYDTDNILGITYTDGIVSDPGRARFIEVI